MPVAQLLPPLARFLVFTLILSLAVPLPLVGGVASARVRDDAPGKAQVLKRLNSPERAAAIESMRKEETLRGERRKNNFPASPPSNSPLSTPQWGDTGENMTLAQTPPKAGQGNSVPLQGSKGQRPLAAGGQATDRPRTMTEVVFNGVTGFMGMPGLQENSYDPHNPNADQGLGFHADGTARRADGTTGTNAASSSFDGRRAAAYAGAGLGYGQNNMSGYYGAGYDPATGRNFRYGDSTYLGQQGRQSGGYGLFNMNDPQSYFMQRGLNYGMGMVNSAAEGLFLDVMQSPYGGAKARLNFMVDLDGRVNGEGDILLPWWDSKYTTVYTQLGARSMSGMSGGGNDGRSADRWIGNFGIGQRWYPNAINEGTGEDAGNLMLGYNIFFDNDFTRSHQRGGVGIEGQWDWFHLASNYYMPLSGWKGSKDFDSHFVKERAAEGWDIRAKGYLPFYRNLAVTGAYTKWKGDHVGMFSSSKLEKNPSVWSYGLEYTPIPLVSGYVTQRSTERGRSDTEFGLRMTYTFNLPWDEQTSHAKVAQTRTVGASRHEFVDRENRIILEYKAKDNYHIEYLGPDGARGFKFRIRHAFDGYVAGQTVRVTAGGAHLVEAPQVAPTTFFAQAVNFLDTLISVKAAHAADFSKTYVTDGQGHFWVPLEASAPAQTQVTVQAGSSSQVFTLQGSGGGTYGLSASSSTATNNGQVTLTLTTPDQNANITWNVTGPGSLTTQPATTNASGNATATLTANGTGSGAITITATVNGQPYSVTVNIPSSGYSLTLVAGTPNPAQSGNSVMTATVLENGSPASGKTVTFTWKNKLGTQAQQTGGSSVTTGTGVATYTQNNPDGIQRTMVVTATVEGQTATAEVQFGAALPAGFIVGPGGSNGDAFAGQSLTWDNAVTFCQQQGGQLPANTTYTVAGGFPGGDYWTRQEHTADGAIILTGGAIGLSFSGFVVHKTNPNQVVCVQ